MTDDEEADGEGTCPAGKAEGTNLTVCELNGLKHVKDNICEKLLDDKIDCNQLFEDVKAGKITRDEFVNTISNAISSSDDNVKTKAKETLGGT